MATVHFKSASSINPYSSVLLAFVGVALHKQVSKEGLGMYLLG